MATPSLYKLLIFTPRLPISKEILTHALQLEYTTQWSSQFLFINVPQVEKSRNFHTEIQQAQNLRISNPGGGIKKVFY